MAKIYYSKEVKAVMDAEINAMASALIGDKDLSDEALITGVNQVRQFRDFENRIMQILYELDRREEEEIAAYRKQKEEAGNGTST